MGTDKDDLGLAAGKTIATPAAPGSRTNPKFFMPTAFGATHPSAVLGVQKTTDLPPDVRRSAAHRLSAISLLGVVLFLLAFITQFIMHRLEVFDWPRLSTLIFGIAFSSAMFIMSRRKKDDPKLLIDFGHVYMVLMTLVIATAEFWGLDSYPGERLRMLWVGFWIILYPAIVPSTPRKVIASAASALVMVFIGFLIGLASGNPVPTMTEATTLLFGTAVAAAISVVPSRILYRLSRQLTKARQMGSYELVRLLGAGGMGEVWEARHRMLARNAAVKIIRKDAVGGNPDLAMTVLQRFEREAQATAQLRSAHTIDLYDFGVTSDGTFYYAMEMLQGLDLETLVREHGAVPPERAVFLLRQACHSLAEAHHNGLIHRDIKPANIFVCRMGLDLDYIKVLDFGLVKGRITPDEQNDVRLTAQNTIAGTPSYMSPEGVMGEDADAYSDIYALGCVAYWLLTGLLVFEADNPMKMLLAHVQKKPELPSIRANVEIPAALESIVMQCLEKDPGRRPQSAADLGRMLGGCGLSKTWTDERMSSWWEAHQEAICD